MKQWSYENCNNKFDNKYQNDKNCDKSEEHYQHKNVANRKSNDGIDNYFPSESKAKC